MASECGRLGAVCISSFVLAEAGLSLNGWRATAHRRLGHLASAQLRLHTDGFHSTYRLVPLRRASYRAQVPV